MLSHLYLNKLWGQKNKMRKGIFSQELEGFNFKEKAYVYGGLIAGALVPIVAGKYIISGINEVKTPLSEAFSWGASIVGNLLSFVTFPTTPILYTTSFGMLIGTLAAKMSKERRNAKESLEESINDISDYLNCPTNEEDLCNLIHSYRKDMKSINFRNLPISKKYNKKLARLTERLDFVPIK